ncbi:NYN domain-containing protein [Halomarina rubra]|uniref:NYN domain-containing protein n=1 Tax=Halomarina rubra TaxID=2071873 RepID=A0ABD6AZE2_9EURY|nr:NYN domain-containing protein [Halomarina rubra]
MSGLFQRFTSDGTRGEGSVGLFVDGPNVFREEFDVDLADLRSVAEERGRVAVARLYVNEQAPAGLIRAGEAHGFEVVTTSGDVDVKLAVDAVAGAVAGEFDVLAVASRDMDFKPALEVAARNGVTTLAIAPGTHGRSDALQRTAHEAVTLGD